MQYAALTDGMKAINAACVTRIRGERYVLFIYIYFFFGIFEVYVFLEWILVLGDRNIV